MFNLKTEQVSLPTPGFLNNSLVLLKQVCARSITIMMSSVPNLLTNYAEVCKYIDVASYSDRALGRNEVIVMDG